MGLNDRPSPEQLRTLTPNQIRDQFEIGMQEAARLIKVQRLRDGISALRLSRPQLREVLDGMLDLIAGEQ